MEIKLTHVITNEGNLIRKKAVAVEGEGIFDEINNEYPAGFDQQGKLVALEVNHKDEVINFSGEVISEKITLRTKLNELE